MKNTNQIECPRCSGTGKVEHTHVVYGICFMCVGSGMVYPKRVEELSKKAILRKAKKQDKQNAILAQDKIEEENKKNAYEEWQYDKNIAFYNARIKKSLSVGAADFLDKVEGISKIVKCDTKGLFDEMVADYFKGSSYDFRYELSKYTNDVYGFCFMEIPKDFDLESGTSIINEYKYLTK